MGTTVAVPIRQARKVVRPIDLTRRLLALLGPSTDGARQSLVSLCLNSSTSLLAGAVLGSITGTFERLPGLLVLVPAAIGLRGNVFSSLGNRLSTSIHVGTFRLSLRPQHPGGPERRRVARPHPHALAAAGGGGQGGGRRPGRGMTPSPCSTWP